MSCATMKRLMNSSIAVACALLVGAILTAALPQRSSADERFDYKVRNDFFAGFAGNQAALERGMKASEEILARNPKHAEALVWHGSGLLALSGLASQKGDAEKSRELWARGLKEMDDAGTLEPENVGVLAPRGSIYIHASVSMPPAQGRPLLQKGVGDFEKIQEIQKAYFQELGTHPRGELLFGLAQGWYRLGNEDKARVYFERVVKDLPGSEYEKRAKTWLETKTLSKDQMGCIGCHVQ